MPSYYSVVQYVPDPVADERVNIGVVALDGSSVRSRFLTNWQRVRAFGAEDVSFLREFVKHVEDVWESDQMPLEGVGNIPHPDEERLQALAGGWINSIQFTTPRASLLSPEDLLRSVASKFLKRDVAVKRAFRDRRAAAAVAVATLKRVVRAEVGDEWKKHVRRRQRISGQWDEHEFDVAVGNGDLLVAAQGLSFEGPARPEISREIKATAWSVDDVRTRQRSLDLAILALLPASHSKTYDRARRIFEGLGATVVEEGEAEDWAKDIAGRLR